MDKVGEDLHVVVVGAGIIGLLIAQGLKKNGISVTIVEAQPAIDTRAEDWTVAVHWSYSLVENLLPESINQKIRDIFADPFYPYTLPVESVPFYHGETGEILAKIPAPGLRRFARRRAREMFTEGLDIQWQKTVVDINFGDAATKPVLTFKDGSTLGAHLVIGVDGANSIIRERILGVDAARATMCDVISTTVNVNFHNVEKAKFARSGDPITALTYGPKGMIIINSEGSSHVHFNIVIPAHRVLVLDVKDQDDPLTWDFQIAGTYVESFVASLPAGTSPLQQLKEHAKFFCEPFKSTISWVPDDSKAWSARPRSWVPQKWESRSSMTLAGDAAHPMLPWRGQGLNHGIADASQIVSRLVKVKSGHLTLKEAIQSYEEEMIPRAAEEVKLSDGNAKMVHDFNILLQSPVMQRGVAKST